MDNVISLSGINKIYGSEIKTQVLYDINLDIRAQSFASIIGASGSGKSTLLNIISTLDRPTSGSVVINGIQTTKMTKADLAKLRNETIGFVFQFHYLLPEFTALENVLMPARIRDGKVTKDTLDRARELLKLMGIEKVANNNAGKMSGGQQQRTALARALVTRPRLLLLDEPLSALDTDLRVELREELRQQLRTLNIPVVLVTHDAAEAQRLGDQLIVMGAGR